MSEKLKKVVIYTDGACSGNPGPGGWGAYLRCENFEKKIYGSDEFTTNNRMEIQAAIEGLKLLKYRCEAKIYTDSMYLKKGITEWIAGWKKNNWLKNDKKLVKNADLWQDLDLLTSRHYVEWYWVKGHSDEEGNIIADSLAVKGCNEAKNLITK